MGYQLWTSPLTGYRRKGTKFEAIKQIFIDNITAKCIYEPLLCCPIKSYSYEAKEASIKRDFDVAGVIDTTTGFIVGYVVAEDIGDDYFKKYVKDINHELLISDSTPLAGIFSVLSHKRFVFVIYSNNIIGIITRADINKPPVRIYIFGILSLVEMHLNFWINYYYQNNVWSSKVNQLRMEKAKETYGQRKGNSQELTLLECLQLCDKRDLLKGENKFLAKFNFSNRLFETLIKRTEIIRNELAHSQNSIISNLGWNEFIETIEKMENFLDDSDREVESLAKTDSNYQDLLFMHNT
jgi:hypothetical protein